MASEGAPTIATCAAAEATRGGRVTSKSLGRFTAAQSPLPTDLAEVGSSLMLSNLGI